jgi:hypothetical protein
VQQAVLQAATATAVGAPTLHPAAAGAAAAAAAAAMGH